MKKFCVKIKASCILSEHEQSVYVPSENLHLLGEPHCYIWIHAESEEEIISMLGKEQKIMEIVS